MPPIVAHDERMRHFETEAGPLLEKLAEVRACQTYCQRYGATPSLDSLEQDVLRRLATLRANVGLVVH